MGAFGNVPDEDVEIVGRLANVAADVSQRMPISAPSSWGIVTYEHVLEALLKDWVENGTDDLDDEDAEDLTNIVRASVEIALAQDPAHQDVAYRTILRGWLLDWVQNWNVED